VAPVTFKGIRVALCIWLVVLFSGAAIGAFVGHAMAENWRESR
jgi:uncharacterized membrane protein SpoIIM required for sporulation